MFDTPQDPCKGTRYFAELPVSGFAARSMDLQWVLPAQYPQAILFLERATFVTEAGSRAASRSEFTFSDDQRWRRHILASGETVFENLRALPWAWFTREIRPVPTNEQAVAIVHAGFLPGGREFDPSRTALVVGAAPSLQRGDPPTDGSGDEIRVERWQSGGITLAAQVGSPGMVVVSQRYYPGWRARIDGQEARILMVDGFVQGVEINAGRHRIEMEFAPAWLPWLCLIAGVCLIITLVMIVRGRRPVGSSDGR
jgi:hypothetical protein